MKRPADERIPGIIDRFLKGNATGDELAELAAWRAESPVNEVEYRRMERLIHTARSLGVPVGTAPARPTGASIVDAIDHTRTAEVGRVGKRGPLWAPWCIAAAAAVVALLGYADRRPADWAPAEVVTGTTELATVKLAEWYRGATCSLEQTARAGRQLP